MNPTDGSNPVGIGQNGVLGEVVNPIAEMIFPNPSVSRFPWLSVMKYAHSAGFGPPVRNLVSKVAPGAAEIGMFQITGPY